MEVRITPATFVVNSILDEVDTNPGNGTVDTASGNVTLRAAIMESNALAGDDTITLGSGTYTLSLTGTGENAAATGDLDITSNVTIIGAGMDQTTIDANQIDRVFHLPSGGSLTVQGLTLTRGRLDDSGGAVRTSSGSVTVISSRFHDNAPTGNGHGGAIYAEFSNLTITDSVLSNNRAGTVSMGGAISTTAGTTIISGSAFVGNSAGAGGALALNGSAALTNTTVSGNTSINGSFQSTGAITTGGFGNPVYTITNSTITANSGGGIDHNGGEIQLRNTIVAANGDFDIFGTVNSLGYNLIGNTANTTITGDTTGNLLNVSPNLGPLASNGGPTQTHALLAGSPAIDAGSPTTTLATDQRGAPRALDGNGDGSARVDMGAFEFGAGTLVTSFTDGGAGSLRQAIIDANASPGNDTITLVPGTYSVSIGGSNEDNGATGDFDIKPGGGTLTIRGFGAASTTIDANQIDRAFHVLGGATLNVEGVTIRDGDAGNSAGGGAIFNQGTLTVTDTTITASTAGGGGGVYNLGGTATITGSTFTSNIAGNTDGGGILNASGGVVTVTDTTFTDNRSNLGNGGGISNEAAMAISRSLFQANIGADDGGGIYNIGTLGIANSTFSGNEASANGGAIFNRAGGSVELVHSTVTSNRARFLFAGGLFNDAGATFTVSHSIIAGNLDDDGSNDVKGTFVSAGNNLIGNIGQGVGFTNGMNDDLVGGGGDPVINPMLGALANNGGPTLTHAPLAGSPAIDAGTPTATVLTDQRGVARVLDGNDDTVVRADIGAVEHFVGFLVDSTVDSVDAAPGDGVAVDSMGRRTLRAAIMEANARTGDNAIALLPGVYTFTLSGINEDAAATGDLDITDTTGTLTIAGAGTASTTINADQLDRVFQILAGATLDLSGVTITGGAGFDGGGFQSAGTLFVRSSIVTGNTAGRDGGAINSTGVLTLTSSTVSNNFAADKGGGFNVSGVVGIFDSTISGNTGAMEGGGIRSAADLEIDNSTISSNSGPGAAGVHVYSGQVTVTNSQINSNNGRGFTASLGAGGTVEITGSTISGNSARGVTLQGATTTITNTTIANNTQSPGLSTNGGGIFIVNGPSAAATLTVINSTISNNSAPGAGGIRSDEATVTLIQTTVSGNTTSGEGGGIIANGGDFTILHSTITGNQAATGGGLVGIGSPNADIGHTIVAANSATGSDPDTRGTLISLGNNLIGNVGSAIGFTSGVNGDIVGTSGSPIDPLLGPLANNGGTTMTQSPVSGSPAIDAGNNTGAAATDQRGRQRIRDGNGDSVATIDIGAVEAWEGTIAGTKFNDRNADGVRDENGVDNILGNGDDEAGIAGITIYLDTDEDGVLDAGEPTVVTGVGGAYLFTDVEPGTHTVREVVPPGWAQTAPVNNGFSERVFSATTFGALAVADFNNDGLPDIAVTDVANSEIDLVLHDGTSAASVATPVPGALAAADFDGDGAIDIAVAHPIVSSLFVYYGQGDGTFPTNLDYFNGQTITAVAAGDLDGDGRTDLVFRAANDLYISWKLTGRGFGTPVLIGVGVKAERILIGDLSGDGRLDIATANSSDTHVATVILNTGGRAFATAVDYSAVPSNNYDISSGDIDNDGDTDLVVSTLPLGGPDPHGLTILRNNGLGVFSSQFIAEPGTTTDSELADFDGDGDLDVSFQLPGSNIFWHRNNGDGTFAPFEILRTGPFTSVATVALDFDGDGDQDLVASIDHATESDRLSLLRDNRFSHAVVLSAAENETGKDFGNVFVTAPALADTNLSYTVARDDTTNNGVAVTSLLGGITDPNDPSALRGIAITSVNLAAGTAQFSINGGGSWTNISPVSNASALLLTTNTNNRVRLLPASGLTGLVSNAITFRAWDRTSGAQPNKVDTTNNGRITAFSTATDSLAVMVTPAVGANVTVNNLASGNQNNPAVAVTPRGQFLVAWRTDVSSNFDIAARLFDANGMPLANQFTVNTTTANHQWNPSVATDADGDFVIVWHSKDQDGSNYGVYGQRYNAAGQAVGTEFRVNTTVTGNQRDASVAMAPGGQFLVAWSSDSQDGSGTGVYAQRYSAEGVPQGGEFRVNTTTSGEQAEPSVSVDGAGNFVVAWIGAGPGDSDGIFVQRLSPSGTLLGVETRVNDVTTNVQGGVSVTAELDGGFVVVWHSQAQDGAGLGVYARRFDNAGTAVTAGIPVNTHTAGDQQNPVVAIDNGGDFVVSWWGAGPDDGDGVFVRQFTSAGTGVGDQFRVNSNATDVQRLPRVSRNAAGDFVIVWHDGTIDGQGTGIAAQRYDISGDDAGPMVGSVISNGNRIEQAERLVHSVSQITVSFSENLSTTGGATGANSVTNPANWALENTGLGFTVGISGITFGLNATTNKHEAVLTLSSAIADGSYALRAKPSIVDLTGNALDTDFDGTPGGPGDFVRSFVINQPVPTGPEFRVNPTTVNAQIAPAVGMDAAGNFVAAWVSMSQDGDRHGVFAQRFNASGNPLGGEFQVNTTAVNHQNNPFVAVDADGSFVIAWQSDESDGSLAAVFAQRYDVNGNRLGGEFRANTTTENSQHNPWVATKPDGGFIIAWQSEEQDGSGAGIYAQRYDASGSPLGGEFRANTTTQNSQQHPSVAVDADGSFVIAWQSDEQDGSGAGIYAQRYDAGGSPLGGEFQVNTVTAGSQTFPSVALDAQGRIVIAWRTDGGGNLDIAARLFDASGAPIGNQFTVNTTTANTQHNPIVRMDADGDFVVTWYSQFQDGSGYGVYAQRYDASGSRVQGEFRVNTTTVNHQQEPSLGMNPDGDFVIVWTDTEDVFAQRFAGDTSPLAVLSVTANGNTILENERLVHTVSQLAVSFDEQVYLGASGTRIEDAANWVLTVGGVDISSRITDVDYSYSAFPFSSTATINLSSPLVDGNYELRLRDVPQIVDLFGNRLDGDANGTAGADFVRHFVINQPVPVGFETRANTTTPQTQSSPAIAIDSDGDFVIAWQSNFQDGSLYGIYAQRYDAGGNTLGGEFRVNTTAADTQFAASVAMDADGDFVIAWQSYLQDGSLYGIYAQRYDAGGNTRGSEFRVNTTTAGSQRHPAVAMDSDGAFVIAWQSLGQDGSLYGIYAQRYDAGGNTLGGEFRVNTTTFSDQYGASVAMHADGAFVIAWQSLGQDGSLDGIYAQRYDAGGNSLGGEFRVNTTTVNQQLAPAVAMDADGAFVIAWQSDLQDGSGKGIYAQRYDAGGNTLGGEFRVNTTTANSQSFASVAMDADGAFVIAWNSDMQDGSGYGIYAQRYDAGGNTLGGEFRVNTTTANGQYSASVAMDADGGFVVAWEGNGAGDASGVFFQRFGPNTAPTGAAIPNITVNEDSVDRSVDLFSTFGDAYNTDQELTFSIASVSNPGLFASTTVTGQDLFITSRDNDRVLRYNGATGAFVGEFVTNQSGGLDRPVGLTWGPDGNLYVSGGVNTDQVWRYDGTTGAFLNVFVPGGSGLLDPIDLTFGPDGHLYVANTSANTITRYNGATGASMGAFVTAGSGGLAQPNGIDFGPDGNLYVASYTTNSVLRFNGSTGAFMDTFVTAGSGGLNFPYGIRFGSDRQLYVTSVGNSRVYRYDGQTGQFLNQVAAGTADGFEYPIGLAFDAAGDWYVGGQNSENVIRFDGDTGTRIGTFVSAGSGGLDAPEFVEFGPRRLLLDFAANANGSSTITVRATDSGGLFTERTFTVTVSAVQDAPILTDQNLRVELKKEDVPGNGILVADLLVGASDPDANAQRGIAITGVDPSEGTMQFSIDDGANWFPVGAVSNTSSLLLADDGVTRVRFLPNADFYGTAGMVLTFRAWDRTSGTPLQRVNTMANGGSTAFSFDTDVLAWTVNTKIGPETPVNVTTAGAQQNADIAVAPAGDYVVVWEHPSAGTGVDIYARRFEASGAALTNEIIVSGAAGDQTNPSVATDANGNFVVTWQTPNGGNGQEIRARRFGSAGNALGGEIPVNQMTAFDQVTPDVAMTPSGSFVVAFSSFFEDSDQWGVFARRFDAAGNAIGNNIPINSTTTGTQQAPSIAVASDGRFIVAWQSDGQSGGDGIDAVARRFNPAGTPNGGEFLVTGPVAPPGDQIAPQLASSPGGVEHVFVWQSRIGGGDWEIGFSQLDDVELGNATVVIPSVSGNQTDPAVAIDNGGNFFVTWTTPSNGGDVVGLWFDTGGTPALSSDPVVINSTTAGAQGRPVVGFDRGGNHVVAWQSFGQDGSDLGIFSQRFRVSGEVRGIKYEDLNEDGDKDVGEPVLAGWTIYIDENNNGEPDPGELSDVTDANGEYALGPLTTDLNHLVREAQQPGWRLIAPASGNHSVPIGVGRLVTGMDFGNANRSPTTIGIPDKSVTEDAANEVIDLTVAFADFEDTDAQLTYTLTANTNAALFSSASISAGQLTLDYLANASGSSDLTVRATDRAGKFVATTFRVTVAPDNDPPSTSGLPTLNEEEDAADRVIALFPAFADVEDVDGALIYAVVGNTNPGLLAGTSINGGQLTLDYAANANGTAQITVRATDTGVDSGQQQIVKSVETTFTLTVAPMNDQPTTSGIANVDVTEDAANTVIALFPVFADVEDSDANLAYSIQGNTNASLFASASINAATGQLTLDYAPHASGSAQITVRATDTGMDGGQQQAVRFVETTFTVTVAPANDQPTTTGIANVNVDEDAANTVIALFPAFADVEDSDANLTFTVQANTNAALFSSVSINAATGQLTLDYVPNANGMAQITIRATDTGMDGVEQQTALTVETTFVVSVAPINDTPTTGGFSNRNVDEDATDTIIALFPAFADVEDTDEFIAYAIAANTNPDLFSSISINQATGTLTLDYAPNTSGSAQIWVRATDTGVDGGQQQANLFVETTFIVTVTPVNDAPTTSGLGNVNVNEDADNTMVALFPAFADIEDADASLALSVQGNTNSGLFSAVSINPTTGQLTLDYAPNASGSAQITVRATDTGTDAGQSQGPLFAETTFTVAVATINDTPTTQGLGNVNVNEDSADTIISLFPAFADVEDSDAALVHTVAGNTNAGLFTATTINPATGELRLDYAPNANGSATITVRATDTGMDNGQQQAAAFVETTFTVTVAPANDAPTTSGIADVSVIEGATSSVIALFAAFADVENSDAALTYQVVGNTNPSLFLANPQLNPTTGELTLSYAPNTLGSSRITIRATDTGMDGGAQQTPASVEASFEVDVLRVLAGTGRTGFSPGTLVKLTSSPASQTLLGPAGYNGGLDFDAGGVLYGAATSLQIIDPSTGQATVVGSLHNLTTPQFEVRGIAFAPDGRLFGISHDSRFLYRINPATAFVEDIRPLTDEVWGIDFAPDGTLYGAATNLLTLDPATGDTLTVIAQLPNHVTDIDLASDGNIYAAGNGASALYRLDRITGAQSQLGGYTSQLRGLAIQQRGPADPDSFEPNDSRPAARDLGIVTGDKTLRGLSIHQAGNQDWYRFQLDAAGSAGHSLRVSFRDGDGDLDLALFDSTGGFLTQSATSNDVESISLAGRPAGVYFARVVGFNGARNPAYTLSISAPAAPVADFIDVAGGGNVQQEAHELGLVEGRYVLSDLSAHPAGDDDWFAFTTSTEGTANHSVSIEFASVFGNLELGLYDSTGSIINSSLGVTDRESISLDGLRAGAYFVRVFGVSGATNRGYRLFLQTPEPGAPDFAEPNDSRATAFNLSVVEGRLEIPDLSIHQAGNADWFQFQTTEQANNGHFVSIDFAHRLGDLELFLFNSAGAEIQRSTSVTDRERISLAGLPGGTYFVRVNGYLDATNPHYDLILQAPHGQIDPDRLEFNDNPAQPTILDLTKGDVSLAGLSVHASDADVFRIQTTQIATASDSATITFARADGDLTVQILDDDAGNTVLRSAAGGAGDFESLSLAGLPAGTYFVRVTGDTNRYELKIDASVAAGQVDDWTILVYMTASDLAGRAKNDLDELELAASNLPGTVNIGVFLDQSDQPQFRFETGGGAQPAWGDAGRAFITPDVDPSTIATTFERLGEQASGDRETFEDFVVWAKAQRPAARYGLVLWGHGSGVFGSNIDDHDPLAVNRLQVPDLRASLGNLLANNGVRFDLVAFDASLMGMTEVAASLAPYTEVFVASTQVGQSQGFDYDLALDVLQENPGQVSAELLGSRIVETYKRRYNGQSTLTAFNVDQFSNLRSALQAFTMTAASATADDFNAIKAARDSSRSFVNPSFRDLGKVMETLAADTSVSASLRASAVAVNTALRGLVLAEATNPQSFSGLSIYFPNALLAATPDVNYPQLFEDFNTSTGWFSFLEDFTGSADARAGGVEPDAFEGASGNETSTLAHRLFGLAGQYNFDSLTLHRKGDVDYFSFTIASAGGVGNQIALTHEQNVEGAASRVELTVFQVDPDGSENQLGAVNTVSGQAAISLQGQPAGEYRVRVRTPLADPLGIVPRYTLGVVAPAATPANDWIDTDATNANATQQKAFELDWSGDAREFTGLVLPDAGPSTSFDWFTFTGPAIASPPPTRLSINSPTNQLLRLRLLDLAGTELASASGTGSMHVDYTFGPNVRYFVEVSSNNTQNTSYALEFTPPTHQAPELAAIAPQNASVGSLLQFTATATDDGPAGELRFQLLNAPSGASIDAETGVFTWTPSTGQADQTYQLTVVVSDSGVPRLSDSQIVSVTVAPLSGDAAPTVVAVGVHGSAWTGGMGWHTIPAGPGQLAPLPWTNMNQVRLVFSEDVSVSVNHLTVDGLTGSYAFAAGGVGFSYDSQTFTATWTFAQLVSADKLLLTLADSVQDQSGNALDGEWIGAADTFPSGDETAGGDFLFRLNALPGDTDGNSRVDVLDTLLARLRVGQQMGSPSYNPNYDVNGNSIIDVLDTLFIRLRVGQSLPANEPGLSGVLSPVAGLSSSAPQPSQRRSAGARRRGPVFLSPHAARIDEFFSSQWADNTGF